MPVAIFNPNPRYIFSYKEVQEPYAHYERIIKAIYEHCASLPLPLRGNDGIAPALALAHLTIFCNVTLGMYKKADTILFQCLRVLDKQTDWLKTTKARTTNTTKLCRIAEAEAKISRMRVGIIRCRRVIVAPRKRFEMWAKEKKKSMKDMSPDQLVAYQLGPLVSHPDSVAKFFRGVQNTCLRLFVREDKPLR